MPMISTRMTAADFLALPPDDVKCELVHGELVMVASPNLDHAYAVTKLLSLLEGHIEKTAASELYADLDAYFGPEDARRPDLLFFADDRVHLISGSKKPEVSPDLCVEVLSPSNAGYDRTDKFDLYQSAGVPFYWIVDPMEKTVEAYRLEKGIYLRSGHGTGSEILRLPPFADLDIPLARLWRPGPKPQQPQEK